jgi:opacity protein-like surface antigen
MRKYLLAATALLAATISTQAADLKPPDYEPSAFSWNVFYIGGNFGGARTRMGNPAELDDEGRVQLSGTE